MLPVTIVLPGGNTHVHSKTEPRDMLTVFVPEPKDPS